MTFGEKIKKARLDQFFTQKQMADELAVSVISIIRWETGKGKPNLSAQRKFYKYCLNKNIVFPEEKK